MQNTLQEFLSSEQYTYLMFSPQIESRGYNVHSTPTELSPNESSSTPRPLNDASPYDPSLTRGLADVTSMFG
jgi:hypothetical protein